MKHTQKDGLVIKRATRGAGLGLFTTMPIRKGDFVIEQTGELISTEEADRRGGKYLFEINSRWTLDAKGRENLGRYINHSCKPNCESEVIGKKVKIFAIRNIKAGEELSYDYGDEYFDEFIKPIGCKCDACRSKRGKKK